MEKEIEEGLERLDIWLSTVEELKKKKIGIENSISALETAFNQRIAELKMEARDAEIELESQIEKCQSLRQGTVIPVYVPYRDVLKSISMLNDIEASYGGVVDRLKRNLQEAAQKYSF